MKRNKLRIVTPRRISHREALSLICATGEPYGRTMGHWHGVAIKLARCALLGIPAELSEEDWAVLKSGTYPRTCVALFEEMA